MAALADYDHNRGCRIDSEGKIANFFFASNELCFQEHIFCKDGCKLLVVSAAV